jgi:hypothetical protein
MEYLGIRAFFVFFAEEGGEPGLRGRNGAGG